MNDKVKKVGENTWLIEVEENGKTKEKYIQLPPEALAQMGWHEDDTLEWEIVDEERTCYIYKEDNQLFGYFGVMGIYILFGSSYFLLRGEV